MDSPLELPANPTPEQLDVLQKYLKQQQKIESSGGYGKQNYYQDKKEVIGKKLIVFRHKQKKADIYYMRFYVGDKKYKTLSLKTSDESLAIERALDHWRNLQNHIEGGGQVFEVSTQQSIEEYVTYLEELVASKQIKRHTLQSKKTSLKKLALYLESYQRPSDIPASVLDNYVSWRRTKNWDKSKHKRNPNPPTDMTINKELTDFKGFFDYCRKKRKYVQAISYPFIKIDWKKTTEKNPSFDVDDWLSIVYYMRTWVRKTGNRKEYGIFYRQIFCEFLKTLANSGLRPHEALLLKWSDVTLKSKRETLDDGRVKEQVIAHVQVSPETKTGRRLVICPAGIYLKRIRNMYREKRGTAPSQNEYIFQNIGTSHSRADHFVGHPLSDHFFRKLWYELLSDLKADKGIEFDRNYTVYSCRSFFINQRLEMGVAPNFVAKLVGHSIKTMERHYENIQLRNLEPELVDMRRKKLSAGEFQTFDLDALT